MDYLQNVNSMHQFEAKKNHNLVTNQVVSLEKQKLLIRHKVSNLTLHDKFMNLLMIDGKKIKAYNIFYESLRFLEAKSLLKLPVVSKTNKVSLKVDNRKLKFLSATAKVQFPKQSLGLASQIEGAVFARNLIFEAIENVKPSVEVRKVRKGGITYQVPAIIPKKRQETLAIRWIIDAAKNRKKNSKTRFAECLALELTEASKKFGKPRQKRDELHKLAESNRAYIRFRWW